MVLRRRSERETGRGKREGECWVTLIRNSTTRNEPDGSFLVVGWGCEGGGFKLLMQQVQNFGEKVVLL